jgi:hypothetical protein
VIVTDLGSRQHDLHQTGVAAGDVEEAEGRFENVVQGFSKDRPDLAVSQATAFDQLAVRLHCSWNWASAAASTTAPPG